MESVNGNNPVSGASFDELGEVQQRESQDNDRETFSVSAKIGGRTYTITVEATKGAFTAEHVKKLVNDIGADAIKSLGDNFKALEWSKSGMTIKDLKNNHDIRKFDPDGKDKAIKNAVQKINTVFNRHFNLPVDSGKKQQKPQPGKPEGEQPGLQINVRQPSQLREPPNPPHQPIPKPVASSNLSNGELAAVLNGNKLAQPPARPAGPPPPPPAAAGSPAPPPAAGPPPPPPVAAGSPPPPAGPPSTEKIVEQMMKDGELTPPPPPPESQPKNAPSSGPIPMATLPGKEPNAPTPDAPVPPPLQQSAGLPPPHPKAPASPAAGNDFQDQLIKGRAKLKKAEQTQERAEARQPDNMQHLAKSLEKHRKAKQDEPGINEVFNTRELLQIVQRSEVLEENPIYLSLKKSQDIEFKGKTFALEIGDYDELPDTVKEAFEAIPGAKSFIEDEKDFE
ncbi:MAG: hypothetical protein WB791_09260 [Waddliaceae bacterium]